MRLRVIVLLSVALSSAGMAQDDDELTPLTPLPKQKSVKPRPKVRAKPAPKAKPKAKVSGLDEELAPIGPVSQDGYLLVRVASNLTGAQLAVDGKEVGELPLPSQAVPSGEHQVVVRRPGYAAFVKKVAVAAGKTTEIEAKLGAVAAVLTVRSDVAGAEVRFNGELIGSTPLILTEVASGPVELVVSKEGFSKESRQLVLALGRDHLVEVKLERGVSDRPLQVNLAPRDAAPALLTEARADAVPLTKKWYFWAAIGAGVVAVATGVGVGIAASQQTRYLTPAEVCTGQNCAAFIDLTP